MSPSHTQDPASGPPPLRPQDVAATFCATIIDEWIAEGIVHAVVSPGSRSTPLAIALTQRPELSVHVFHDERSASFAALGIGLRTGIPAILLCTSGTASAHFHAAVVEAHLSAVPMLVCTADRPPELRDVGAPQTIDQTALYGTAVRWFHDPGVADEAARHTWRSLASQTLATALGPWPGPVHLNLSFREPLVGDPDALPPRRAVGRSVERGRSALDDAALDRLVARLDARRGLVIAGRGCGDPSVVASFAASLGWPVLADARCGLRTGASSYQAVTIAGFDEIVRITPFIAAHAPEVVIRLGETPVSKVLGQWLAGLDIDQIHVAATPRRADADAVVGLQITTDPTTLLRSLTGRPTMADGGWLGDWLDAERRVQRAIDDALAAHDAAGLMAEPTIARMLGRSLPPGSNLVVSSSMPIRDVEWYAYTTGGAHVLSNRGANGIDGVIATAIGVALATNAPTYVLIGDVALLHDSSSLAGLGGRGVDVRIVVIDNDGGGIFSFLPQAARLEPSRFEQLFGTPHGTDFVALAAAHHLPVMQPTSVVAFTAALAVPGPGLVLLHSERAGNVTVHDELHHAVARAMA